MTKRLLKVTQKLSSFLTDFIKRLNNCHEFSTTKIFSFWLHGNGRPMRAKERKVLTLILNFAWAAGPFSRGSQIAPITASEHDVLSRERKFKILRDSGVFSLPIDQSKLLEKL